MKRGIFLSLALIIFASGCSMLGTRGKQSLTGTWSGEMPQGGVITMTFKDDMTVQGEISGGMDFTFNAKYAADFSKNPATFDQFDFNNNDMGDMRYLGIIRFVDANTLQMCGNIDSQGDRPQDFNENAITLKRK